MRTARIILLFVISTALFFGCGDSQSARFANIEGLAGNHDKYQNGALLSLWGYAKKCERDEVLKLVGNYPFIYEFSNSRENSGIRIIVVSRAELPEGRKINVCGRWTKTLKINYLILE